MKACFLCGAVIRLRLDNDGAVILKLWCGLLDYATAYADGLLDYVTVYADGLLTFTFKNGSAFEG